MALLVDFIPYVVPFAAGCADPLALRAIREAVARFCEESLLVQSRQTLQKIEDADAVVGDFDASFYAGLTVNGELRYPIATLGSAQYVGVAPTGMRPHQILSMWADDSVVEPVPTSHLDVTPNWPARDGAAMYFTRLGNEAAVLTPVPQTLPATLSASIAYTTQLAGSQVPDVLLYQWRTGIQHGALAYLYSIPGQPFSDPNAAEMNGVKFRTEIAKARIEVNRGRTVASVAPRPVFFE